MTTISLHKYHEQINYLLEDSQYSLAANHCRYILQQHPRHVDTYRLLARTMIEQGDYTAATELFQRVLSADPNDYIAHAGLSVVYREEDVLSQAIWHLERAYEIEPYNGAIQNELKGLYIDHSEQNARHKEGGDVIDVPDSLPLTKGALARLYIKGEFYTQAIDILIEALAEDEDRIDLEVLLAEALWRDYQRKTAVQVCLRVLEKLPNCITANAVLAEIWLQIGRIDEAQAYLKELQELTLLDGSSQDLESPVGSAFQPKGAISLPNILEVERMGDDLDLTTRQPMMASSEDSLAPDEGEDDYQWLEGLGEELVVGDGEVTSEEPEPIITDSDWLRRELEASDEEIAVSEELSDWLEEPIDTPVDEISSLIEESTESDEDSEDAGFDALGAVAAGAVAAGVISSQMNDDDDETEVDEEDPFGWLAESDFDAEIPQDDDTIFDQIEHAEEAGEVPDWLADISDDELEPVQVDPAEASIIVESDDDSDSFLEDDDSGDDMYDWLSDAISDEPLEELEPGELDLSQFAEFDTDEVADTNDVDDGEVVWRLTDELNPPTEDEEELEEFDFEIAPDETGELEDVPDWLMGSSGVDELGAASPTEEAGSEIADELAEWVAANQPDMEESEETLDWLADEPETTDASVVEPEHEQIDEDEEEDEFFTSDLPDWMMDSPSTIDESSPLDSAPLPTEEAVVEDSGSLVEEDLPDWLTGGSEDLVDSGFLETDGLSEGSTIDATSESNEDLPEWLLGGEQDLEDSGFLDTGGLTESSSVDTGQEPNEDLPNWLLGDEGSLTTAEDDEQHLPTLGEEDLPDWLIDGDEQEDTQSQEEDGPSETAVVGGLLGAAAAGALAHEFLKDDEEDNEDQPEQLIKDSSLDDEVMEDAVSEKQDGLNGPQDEQEKPEPLPQEDSDDFDWLDDLDGSSLSTDSDSLPADDFGDDLDWMDLDADEDTDDLNLDALLGLESEEEEKIEESAEPILSGLAEDESLDWLDALADDETEAVDEMPTWQWSEDSEEDPSPALDESIADVSEKPDIDIEMSSDAEEAPGVVEDLDDAMSWLEDLAAEPDAPVEELPSVAEDMDLDALFAVEPDEASMDESVSEEADSLAEIVAADSQNDSWLQGLSEADEEPIPDFIQEDESSFNLDDLLDDSTDETTVSSQDVQSSEDMEDVGIPPEDPEEAMAWLEQLAARQGAPLDELPSVEEDEGAQEEDGIGAAEVVAGAAAIGVVGKMLEGEDEGDEEEAIEYIDQVPEIAGTEEPAAADELMSMEVPEDPEEAMAWLEQLAARQGAPLDELPSVSEDDEIPLVTESLADDDLFGLDADESGLDDLLADADALPDLVEADDDALAWLDNLDDSGDQPEISVEETEGEFDEFATVDLGSIDDEEQEESVVEEAPIEASEKDLNAELDWLESEIGSASDSAKYNADEMSVSDEDLNNALEQLALLTVAGAAIGAVREEEDVETVVEETAVSEELDVEVSGEDIIEEMPEDPDEAMAWLEKLAARQGAPLDELPSVEEDEYDELAVAGTIAEEDEGSPADLLESDLPLDSIGEETIVSDETADAVSPEDMDMDDAMAWLEQLAARQGAELDELPTVDESDLDGDVEAPEWVADAQELGEPAQAEDEQPEPETTLDSVDEVHSESEEEQMTLPEDMDMDDAMAWLEQLAARQGAELDELPTVDDVPESESDIDTPEWIAKQTGPLDPETIESLDIPEVSDEPLDTIDDDDFFAALDEVPAIEGIETGSLDSDDSLTPDMEDIDDSMPDWLSGEEGGEEESPLGHTGWLNTIGESDMGGWLAAEAEATSTSDVLDDSMPEAIDTDSLMSTGGLEETGGLQDTAPRVDTGELRSPEDISRGSVFTTELDEAQVLADLDLDDFGVGLDQAQLEAARSSLAGGDIDAALHDYQGLVEAGESMHTVISDLERASELHQDKPMVRRMLGDAYMRNGQINKAIETYRTALDQM